MNNPKISVVTVCFNAVNNIEDTMLSVLNQTYNNIEYIIIDGESTDGTVNIIKKFSDRLAYWVSEPDNGIYDAMNKGINVATGDYINFMNAGDRFVSPETISSIIPSLKYNEVNYGNVIRYNNKAQQLYGGKFSKRRLIHENVCHQSIFYPLQLIQKERYNLKYKILGDWELNMRLWKYIKFNYIDLPISYYLEGGISDKKEDFEFKKQHRILILKNLGLDSYMLSIKDAIIKRIHGQS